MNYKNYSLSSSKGKLYLKEKTPTDGYEKVTYGTNGENTTYHKYVDSIKGIPSLLEIKEIQYEGRTLKFLELTLVDGDDANKVSVPLKNKGGYTDEVKALISSLNGLELGEEVTLNPSLNKYTNSKGVDKTQLQLYINYTGRKNEEGKNLSTGYITFADIPKPTSKVVAGDTVWDFSPQTEFYYSKLTEIESRFKTQTPSSSAQPSKATAKEAFEPANSDIEIDYTDLPF